jgi:leader peptidase (prepilin peptidase) / N-methyltransferase
MIEALIAFAAGLLIGSFLNVCIYRLPRDMSVVHPRSHCPGCERQIAWHDNIPVLSYVLLRGRCRFCTYSIPLRYPIVEFVTGLLFAWAVLALGPTPAAFKACIFAAIIVTLVASDIEERILPDEFTLGGTAVGLALAWLIPMQPALAGLFASPETNLRLLSLIEGAIGAGVSSGVLLGVAKLYEWIRHREGMGLGDVKMVAMVGAFLGLQGALLTLVAGSFIGGIGGLIFILLTGKDASTYQLPFGAFLGVAALAVSAFGESVVLWYWSLGA